MVDADERALLDESQRTHEIIRVIVNGCAYSCCGKGWRRKDGYEQEYSGYVDNHKPPAPAKRVEGVVIPPETVGTFMLYSPGIGTMSYVIAVRYSEVEVIERHH